MYQCCVHFVNLCNLQNVLWDIARVAIRLRLGSG